MWAKLVTSGGEEKCVESFDKTDRNILLKDLGVSKRLILKGAASVV